MTSGSGNNDNDRGVLEPYLQSYDLVKMVIFYLNFSDWVDRLIATSKLMKRPWIDSEKKQIWKEWLQHTPLYENITWHVNDPNDTTGTKFLYHEIQLQFRTWILRGHSDVCRCFYCRVSFNTSRAYGVYDRPLMMCIRRSDNKIVGEAWSDSGGLLHRDGNDKPSKMDIDKHGIKHEYFHKHGVMHRENGQPAIIHTDLKTGKIRYREWVVNGVAIQHQEFNEPIKCGHEKYPKRINMRLHSRDLKIPIETIDRVLFDAYL